MIYSPSKKLTEAVKRFEGLRLTAYKDSGGKLTIGYGHTCGVKAGAKITIQQADIYLCRDLAAVATSVNTLHVCNTQGQFDALCDFAFNLGFDNLKRSTLLKVLRNKGSESEIRKQFSRWVYCAGKILPGLVVRRKWEADRYFGVE